MLLNLLENLMVLLAFGLSYHYVSRWFPSKPVLRQLAFGAVFGLGSVVAMLQAFQYAPGVIFDGRTVMVSLAGLFGGLPGGAVAILIAGAWRAMLGGVGAFVGLTTILSAGLLGILARQLLKDHWPPSWGWLWLFSMVVHLTTLACMFLLPVNLSVEVVREIALPFLVFLPLAGTLLGLMLAHAESVQARVISLHHTDWLFGEAQKLTNFGSWEYDVRTDTATATPQFFQIHGLPETTRGHTLKDTLKLMHADDRERVRQVFMESLRSGEPFDLQSRFTSHDGRNLWIRLVGKPIVEAGKVRQVVGNLIDITVRMRSELELRESQSRLQSILDHAPALICICDAVGVVKVASQRFRILDMAEEELIGKPLYELMPREKNLEQWLDDLVALKAGERIEFEEMLRHRDGSTHTYLTSKFLLGGEKDDQVCYISADITDLKRLAMEREDLVGQLVVKNEELERFTYSISHDLKSPLVTIGGFAELIAGDLKAGREKSAVDSLSHIRDAVADMRQLIDGLLKMSRSGHEASHFERVSLQDVFDSVRLLLHGMLEEHPVEMVAAAGLPTVVGDPLLLRQVLQNLIENALKFRVPERPLKIAIDWFVKENGTVVVSFGDNGQGIAHPDLERIFQLFERGAGSNSGSGIGLALVRTIMVRHGGMVWAESDGPDKGSTFFLSFPYAEQG